MTVKQIDAALLLAEYIQLFPAYPNHPIGAPHSPKRLEQAQHIALEASARDLIRQAKQRAQPDALADFVGPLGEALLPCYCPADPRKKEPHFHNCPALQRSILRERLTLLVSLFYGEPK